MKDSTVSSMPAPTIVTPSTSSERSTRMSNVPLPNATVPPLCTSMSAFCTSVALAPDVRPTHSPVISAHGSGSPPQPTAEATRATKAKRYMGAESARDWSDRQANWSNQPVGAAAKYVLCNTNEHEAQG